MATNHTSNKDFKVDKMRFQLNTGAYWLVMLAIMLNIYYLIFVLNTITITFIIGMKTIVGVVYLMVMFLSAEKLKSYSKEWSIAAFVFGLIAFARIAFVPRMFLTGNDFIEGSILLAIQGLLFIGAAAITYKKASALKEYVERKGVESK